MVPCRDGQNSLKALCVARLGAPGVINHHPVGSGVQSSQCAIEKASWMQNGQESMGAQALGPSGHRTSLVQRELSANAD